MDELLECVLPRLRVRKLHMQKTKMGEREHHIGWSQRGSQTPFNISLSSLCPSASHHSSMQWAIRNTRLRLNQKGNVTQIDHQRHFDSHSIQFYAKMSKGNTIRTQIWQSRVILKSINNLNFTLTSDVKSKLNLQTVVGALYTRIMS